MSISLCVFDIECVNALITKMKISGRMADFATYALKTFLHDAHVSFEASHGSPPPDLLRRAMQATEKMVSEVHAQASKKRGPQKGAKTGWGEFVRADAESLGFV
jgi:hypothetical protein